MVYYLNIDCCEGPSLEIIAEELIYKTQSPYQNITVYSTKQFGKCLFLDEMIQCTERDHYIYDRTIIEELNPTDKALLILGGGDGFIADTALKLNPQLDITIVELDKSVIDVSSKYFDQKIFNHPNVKVIIGDAISFLESGIINIYSGIICDLTDFPISSNNNNIYFFYEKLFSLINKTLPPYKGWLSIYAGCNKKNVNLILSKVQGVKVRKAIVPSYGEPCFFIYKTYDL